MIRPLPSLRALAARFTARRAPVFANVATGTHAGLLTRTAGATFTRRHLLAKAGVSAGLVAVCGASDVPVGIVPDEAATDDPVALKLLGTGEQTALLVASATIGAGAWLYAAANGKVQAEPTTAGTYYLVGRALSASTGDGDVLEAETMTPLRVRVLAALTGDAAAQVALLAGALNAPGLVKVLA